jgi:hypothetical protein
MRIHYSTNPQDIQEETPESVTYRNYQETSGFIPYDLVKVSDKGLPRLTVDDGGDRIIFSLPFYDFYDAHRGTALFSLSVRAITERLISLGRLKLGEDVSLVPAPPGMVTGLPHVGRNTLLPLIASLWDAGLLSLNTLNSGSSEANLALLSAKTSQGLYIGRIVDETLFAFPPVMKLILLASFFITAYLSVFLLFNLRQDPMTVVQNRLKRLQINLIEEYYDHKGDVDWGRWKRDLEQRREEVRGELKRGIKLRSGKGAEDIDFLIDKSWDELLAVIGGLREHKTDFIDEVTLRNMLSRLLPASPAGRVGGFSAVLSAAGGAPHAAAAAPFQGPLPQGKPEVAEKREESDREKNVADFLRATGGASDEEVQRMEDTEFGELEELEEPEELEELEQIGPEEITLAENFSPDPVAPQKNIDEVSREIEFGFHPETEDESVQDDGFSNSELEIESPFATILSDFSDATGESNGPTAPPGGPSADNEKKKLSLREEGRLEDLHLDYHYSYFYRPFLLESACAPEVLEAAGKAEMEPLELIDLAAETANGGEESIVLEERDGIMYIPDHILNPRPNTEKKQDPAFKKLLDSIISKK